MAQGDNITETFLEKDVKNDNVPDASDNNVDSKANKEKSDDRPVNNESQPTGENLQGEHNKEVSSISVDKERAKSKPIKLKRKKLEDCRKLLEPTDAQSSIVKEDQKRKWGERHSRSRSRSSENEVLCFDKKKRMLDQKRIRNASENNASQDIDMKNESLESDDKHLGRQQHLDSDSSSGSDNKHKGQKIKVHKKRSESSSSDSSSSSSTGSSSSSSDSDTAKSLGNESPKRKRIDCDKGKTRSSSAESHSSGKHRKGKSNTSDSSDSHTTSHRWERQSKNLTGNNNETKLETSHYKSRGSKASRKSPSPRKTDQKRSFNSQKLHSKDCSRKTSPRDKRTSKENKSSSSPSVGTEEHGKQCPEKDKERLAKISTRKLSLSSRKDEHSSSASERPHGKRRWGSSTKSISKPSLSISTDSLKDLIPDYKPIIKNVVLSSEELSTITNAQEEESSYIQQEANVQSADFTGNEDTAATEGASVKSDSQKDDVVRSPTPPQNPPSCVLHIRNLVRPFTLHQLKEFLKRTGTLVEGGFWIDKIKSKCYVTYETQEQAIETRHALHGTRWPVSNPKTLSVDFATKEELDFHKELPDVSKLQTKKEKPEEKKNSISSINTKKLDDEKRRERSDRTIQPIREWDRDKLTQDSPEHDWQIKEKIRDRGRSPDRRDRKDKKDTKRKQEEETPAKLLDDLFRKTKAAPCIYWLPLTEEQIQLRMQDLRQRRLEREKRREQRDRQEKEKEEAERQQRQKARESRSGKEKESSQQSRSPSGRKR